MTQQDPELEDTETVELPEGFTLMEGQAPNWTPGTLTFYGPETRHLSLSGEITEQLAVAFCSQLQELAVLDPGEPIWIWINTPGGSVIDGLAIYDMMRHVPCPIVTIVNGGALSCGFLLSQGGDLRLSMKNSLFYYHQPILGSGGFTSSKDIKVSQGYYEWCKDKIDTIIRKRSKIRVKDWKDNFQDSRGKYFTAEQALEWKIIDHILEEAPKAVKKIKLKDLS